MKAINRNAIYVVAAVLALIALAAALYVGIIDVSRAVVAIKDTATLAALAMAVWSSLLAKRHLTPDPDVPEEEK